MAVYKLEIPLKLPSCNEYILECRRNKYAGAKMKKSIEESIGLFLGRLPALKSPIKIKFIWVESNKRRDLDGIAFAKKFILDAMVKKGKITDDNRKNVVGFTDEFQYGDKTKVILEIEEV